MAKKDPTVQPELQRFLPKGMDASTKEVDSSYVPMLSNPCRQIASHCHSDSRHKHLRERHRNAARTVGILCDFAQHPHFWEQGAAGSNPAGPTNLINRLFKPRTPWWAETWAEWILPRQIAIASFLLRQKIREIALLCH